MSFFTLSGNKLAATVIAAGALVAGGTGVAAFAVTPTDDATSQVAATESPSPDPSATGIESPAPSPTATETESPEPAPTASETESPEPAPTATETESPEPPPAATEDPAPPVASAAVGVDATGPAAFGLCNAFTHGGLNSTSTAYAALVKAAGSESSIVTYCANVAPPRDRAADQQTEQQSNRAAPETNGAAGHQAGNSQQHSRGHR